MLLPITSRTSGLIVGSSRGGFGALAVVRKSAAAARGAVAQSPARIRRAALRSRRCSRIVAGRGNDLDSARSDARAARKLAEDERQRVRLHRGIERKPIRPGERKLGGETCTIPAAGGHRAPGSARWSCSRPATPRRRHARSSPAGSSQAPTLEIRFPSRSRRPPTLDAAGRRAAARDAGAEGHEMPTTQQRAAWVHVGRNADRHLPRTHGRSATARSTTDRWARASRAATSSTARIGATCATVSERACRAAAGRFELA